MKCAVENKNGDHIDQNGLFIGNHHYPMPEVFVELSKLQGGIK